MLDNQCNFIVRPHTKEDIPHMVQQVVDFFNEEGNRYTKLDIDEEVLYNIAKVALDNPTMFMRVIEDSNGKIVGMIAGEISMYIFSAEKIAREFFLFVQPSFSNVDAAKKLVTSFVTWAQEQNVKEVQIASTTGFKTDKFGKLMELCGLKEIGRTYNKEF